MKKIYTSIITLLAAGAVITATAQQQPNNGGFENWDNVGQDTEEPVGYSGMMTGDLCASCGIGASQRIFRSTDAHSGTYSAEIQSTEFSIPFVIDAFVNGTMTSGQVVAPSTTPSEGYAITLRSNPDFNQPFTDEPDSLVFWAKYNVTNASDSAAIAVILHNDNDHRDPGGIASEVVATASSRFQTDGFAEWKRISIPFVYEQVVNPAAYALITFTSSYQPGAGDATAVLRVDDFEFIYNSPVTSVEEQLEDVVKVYPNPTNDGRVLVSLGNDMKNGMVTVLNMMGQTVGQFSFVNDNRIAVELDQPAGMYFLNIRTEEGKSTTVRVVKK